MHEILILKYSALRLPLGGVEESTYPVCKARNRCDPDLVGSNREVRVGCNEKMMEQTHIRHRLRLLGVVMLNVSPRIHSRKYPTLIAGCLLPEPVAMVEVAASLE